ncbi:MAG: hypothetical protein PSX36_02655 [bacterium]|nr:hypothetical protein [bacterium]
MFKFRIGALLFILVHAHFFSLAQSDSRDVTDVIKEMRHDTSFTPMAGIEVGKNYISVLPFIGYAPANGFMIGGAISISRLMAAPPTNLSSGMLNFQVTTKNQFIINARSKVYLANNKWFLQGDWRILLFTQPTYGLGINNSGGNKTLLAVNNLEEAGLPNAEPMKFNYLRIYEDVVHKLGESNWYVGSGMAVDGHFDIRDEKLDTSTTSPAYYITNHYAYSKVKGFDPTHYYTAGFDLNVLTDTRDNMSNSYKGYYGSLTFRVNPKWTRTSQESIMMLYDVRYYIGLSKNRPRKVLALWSFGNFVVAGNVPYLALPSIGWDTYNRSGRGYIQGRYRGLSMLYAEAEYRYPISSNGLWGGVLFVNNTFAQAIDGGLFDHAAPAAGAGIRLKMDKRARVNLTVDLSYGLDHSSGVYFSMQEAF